MTLDELITSTRAAAASVDPLELLATAARQQQELTDLGEELLDHWVQHARTAGCSWAQIGGSLGVTKQAAQQRHSGVRGLLGRIRGAASGAAPGLFTSFDAETRRLVVIAQEEGRMLRHDHLGTEHLLLGLLGTSSSAAHVLVEAGLDRAAARADVERIVGCGERESSGHIPFTPRAKKVLELSLRESHRLGHKHIGPEHVLLGLLREREGVAAQVISGRGIDLRELTAAVENPA